VLIQDSEYAATKRQQAELISNGVPTAA